MVFLYVFSVCVAFAGGAVGLCRCSFFEAGVVCFAREGISKRLHQGPGKLNTHEEASETAVFNVKAKGN